MNKSDLVHRTYSGSVLFSDEDGMFHGRLLGIRDIVSYGGDNLAALKQNFNAAVDEYIAFCAEVGKVPDIPNIPSDAASIYDC